MIYLDNASTTPLSDNVKGNIIQSLNIFGNPSNFYKIGAEAATIIKESRSNIAEILNCSPNEIYFTSGASEGNAWALSQRLRRFSSYREHHSIQDYPNIQHINPDDILYGTKDFTDSIVAWIMVNNETGENNTLFLQSTEWKTLPCLKHIDATQAVGHIPVDVNSLHCDSLAFSAHKFGGPKGIGVLYINHKSKYKPLIIGSQQAGMRGGTENVIGIQSMALALSESCDKIKENLSMARELKAAIKVGLSDLPSQYWKINSKDGYVPYIVSVSFKDISAESMVLFLQNDDIFVGMGSACNTGNLDPSWVLSDMQIPDDFILGTLRFSFSNTNTIDEILQTTQKIVKFYQLYQRSSL